MARKPRLFVAGMPHHVVQRGNNRQQIFFTDADYFFFLNVLKEAKKKHPCLLYAYCLMMTHIHLLLAPLQEDNIALFMKFLGAKYVRYINKAYGRTGTLWEGRFKCSLVQDDAYLAACVRYIEMNPVRAGLAASPGEYRWSSYRFRAYGEDYAIVDRDPWYEGLASQDYERQQEYRRFFQMPEDEGTTGLIREMTLKGGIVGKEGFKARIRQLTGREIVLRPPGRPELQNK
ncbi:MAG: transposase [Candidatus Omnitrophica bacterium]|nr:transposase [Candidatus Omnitrophota bacterium]